MLTRYLLKAFVSDYRDTTRARVRTAYGHLEAWVSIIINAVLFAVKLALGLMVNSLALIADAVHTVSDVATAMVVLFGFKIAGKPADKEHPFGHGRAEYVATLIIALMLGVIGFEFIKSAAERIFAPAQVTAGWGTLAVIAATIGVKLWLGRFSNYLGIQIQSSTLAADAWHHRSDAISSGLVLLAVGGSALGYPILDGVGGLLVGLYLIWSGVSIARQVIDPLLGEPPAPELVQKIRRICSQHEQVLDAHDITVHHYGQHMYIGAHVEVGMEHSAQAAHDIAEDVTTRLKEQLGAYAIVHIDPIDRESAAVHQVSDRLKELLHKREAFADFHDLRVVKTADHNAILFDLVVHPDTSERDQQATRRWVEQELARDFPAAEVEINISPPHVYR